MSTLVQAGTRKMIASQNQGFVTCSSFFINNDYSKNCKKLWRQKFYDYRTFTIRNFILFALRYSLFGFICCSLFSIPCSNYTNREYSITMSFFGKYFEFYKPIVNFIFIGLDTIFYFRSVCKVAKNQIAVHFYCCVCLYCLRQEINWSFWKDYININITLPSFEDELFSWTLFCPILFLIIVIITH